MDTTDPSADLANQTLPSSLAPPAACACQNPLTRKVPPVASTKSAVTHSNSLEQASYSVIKQM